MKRIAIFILIFLILFAFTYSADETFYSILNVREDAGQSEIKIAFKNMSLKYHPDKNKNNKEEAKKMFVKIANAYEVLSDPVKRQDYDTKLRMKKSGFNLEVEDFDFGFDFSSFEEMFDSVFKHFDTERKEKSKSKKSKSKDYYTINDDDQYDHSYTEEDSESDSPYESHDDRENIFDNSEIKILTIENISELYKRKDPWFIFLFSIDDLDDIYLNEMERLIKLTSDLANIVNKEISFSVLKIAAVDCDYDTEVCEEIYKRANNFIKNEMSLPAFIFYNDNFGVIYRGKLEVYLVLEFINSQIINFVNHLDRNNYDDIITDSDETSTTTHIILFTNESDNLSSLSLSLQILFKFTAKRNVENSSKIINFYQTNDELLIKLFKVKDNIALGFVTDPFNFKASLYKGKVKEKFSLSSIEKFIKSQIKNFKGYKNIHKSMGKSSISVPEYIPQNKRNQCNCDSKNICGIFIIYENENNKKLRISESKRKFAKSIMNNSLKGSKIVKFCYVEESDLENFLRLFGKDSSIIFQEEKKMINILFIQWGKNLYVYNSNINFIDTISFIDNISMNVNLVNNKYSKDEL